MTTKKLISKYRSRILKNKKHILFVTGSMETNKAAGRLIVAKEQQIIINSCSSKIRIYLTVIEDLKTLTFS